MSEFQKMIVGAKKILNQCISIEEEETLLIITDSKMDQVICDALMEAARFFSVEPTLVQMEQRKMDGDEPPAPVASAMMDADAILCPVSVSITHTQAVKNAAKAGSRILVMTAFTRRLMMEGGINADFKAQAPICKKLASIFHDGSKIDIKTPGGTNLQAKIEKRRGNALTCIVKPGQFSTLPTIEANVSPVEGTANGIIVADASIPYLGIGFLDEPITFKVENGFITDIEETNQSAILKDNLKSKGNIHVYNIAEFGVGLNPECKMTGVMLDDEGVLGSAHIGIGSNLTLGGNLKAPIHYDLVIWKPTVIVDDSLIIKKGELVFNS